MGKKTGKKKGAERHRGLFPHSPTPKEQVSSQVRQPGLSVRQEVLNVLVAQMLQDRGLIAAPEQIIDLPSGSRRMPDVLVDFLGLRLAIEGEFSGTQAEDKSSQKALERVEEGIAHVGVALVYPSGLKAFAGNVAALKKALAGEGLQFAIITEKEATQKELFPTARKGDVVTFIRGDMNSLADALRRCYEQLVRDEVLESAVKQLQEGIGVFIGCLIRQPAATARLASALGIKELQQPRTPRSGPDQE